MSTAKMSRLTTVLSSTFLLPEVDLRFLVLAKSRSSPVGLINDYGVNLFNLTSCSVIWPLLLYGQGLWFLKEPNLQILQLHSDTILEPGSNSSLPKQCVFSSSRCEVHTRFVTQNGYYVVCFLIRRGLVYYLNNSFETEQAVHLSSRIKVSPKSKRMLEYSFSFFSLKKKPPKSGKGEGKR